ncbi:MULTISPECIES: hypothetical protein [Bacillus]|uniref:hypothetical protein n=1 Tax=Bacillus TaxID=1386 RepID=UPI000AEBF3E5|nr:MULTISPECIES: hypothetical protein [Bacillus amyloliquefaciens group]ASS62713.1 hypothetical protein CHN56_02252 [Bacillus velezensis]ATC51315.1 hypothetical protein CLI97_02008 [Bacillus velezensis]MCW5194603.1 hypothetical protein [Bacillus amyloliquefaciens]QOC79715.1 hypothetical protein ID168_18695 [Bacillus velezensis]QYM56652.1 hypothetical protein KNV92_18725 [Bacillus velezensis]
MKKKLAAVTVTILLVSVITNSFLNGGKPDWINVCCTLLACLLGILFVLRLEKRENT